MRWDLKILRQKVKTVHGEKQLQKLDPCLNSIAERHLFAQFHFDQAEEAIISYLDGNMGDKDLLLMMLSPEERERHNFNDNRWKAKAHIHACLQNMHCIADTMGHVVYFSLALNDAKKESDISIKNVRNWIKKKSKYNVLTASIEELITNDDYAYLEAIVNHSKHRSIIDLNLVLSFIPEEPSPTLESKPFAHKGKGYDKRPIREYLKDEFYRQGKLIVSIGNEINSLV